MLLRGLPGLRFDFVTHTLSISWLTVRATRTFFFGFMPPFTGVENSVKGEEVGTGGFLGLLDFGVCQFLQIALAPF